MSPHITTFLKISIIINLFVMTVLVVIAANGACEDAELLGPEIFLPMGCVKKAN